MGSRASKTIVLVNRHALVRADFSRANSLLGVWAKTGSESQEWLTELETALGLGPKLGKTVYILSSDLWTQTLSLTHDSANMSSQELASALSFEAEALSGLSAF
jgi:hypothetical protein